MLLYSHIQRLTVDSVSWFYISLLWTPQASQAWVPIGEIWLRFFVCWVDVLFWPTRTGKRNDSEGGIAEFSSHRDSTLHGRRNGIAWICAVSHRAYCLLVVGDTYFPTLTFHPYPSPYCCRFAYQYCQQSIDSDALVQGMGVRTRHQPLLI